MIVINSYIMMKNNDTDSDNKTILKKLYIIR